MRGSRAVVDSAVRGWGCNGPIWPTLNGILLDPINGIDLPSIRVCSGDMFITLNNVCQSCGKSRQPGTKSQIEQMNKLTVESVRFQTLSVIPLIVRMTRLSRVHWSCGPMVWDCEENERMPKFRGFITGSGKTPQPGGGNETGNRLSFRNTRAGEEKNGSR